MRQRRFFDGPDDISEPKIPEDYDGFTPKLSI